MDKAEKKRIKAEQKAAKKTAKAAEKTAGAAAIDPTADQPPAGMGGDAREEEKASLGVRIADAVKGLIYLVFATTLLAAVLLGETGLIVTLDDIIGNLFAAIAGKVVIAFIALALFVYGLKNLKIVK